MNVIDIPRDEVIALVQEAAVHAGVCAADAILLKRQAEQAPHLSFGLTTHIYQGKPCACPAARAGLSLAMSSSAARFAGRFDRLVREKYDLPTFGEGVLVIA